MNANHMKNEGAAKAFAVVMLIITLLFAVNVPSFAEVVGTDAAMIGEVGYSTLDEALVAAVDGDVITLLEDATIYGALTIEKDITLDLSTFTVTVKAMGDAVTVLSKLTVRGEGCLISYESDLITVGSDSASGELVIEGGYLLGHNSVVTVVNGSAVINGGDLSTNPTVSEGSEPDYSKLLSIEPSEAEGATATITVNGGVFHGFNPNDEEVNYIGSACGTLESEGIYTVIAHSFTDYHYNDDESCGRDGTKTARCNHCEATDTVTAEGTKLGSHVFENFKCVNCGYVQLTLLGYAALGIVVFTVLFFFAGISKLVR